MIDHLLVDTITKMPSTRDEYGDIIYSSGVQMPCRFREINSLNRAVANKEELDCDALVHFAADASVELGDVFIYGNTYYRVDSMVKARAGGSTAVEFLKCGLLRHRQVS
jgi:hypothetical protein